MDTADGCPRSAGRSARQYAEHVDHVDGRRAALLVHEASFTPLSGTTPDLEGVARLFAAGLGATVGEVPAG